MVWKKGKQKKYRTRLKDIWRGEKYEPLKNYHSRFALGVKAENKALEHILPNLGFKNIIPLNDYSNKSKHLKRRTFPWDFYAEKEGKWVIEVTTDVTEHLERKLPFLWKLIGTRMAVLFISPTSDKYVFKEVTTLNKTQVCLCLKDLGEVQIWNNGHHKGVRPKVTNDKGHKLHLKRINNKNYRQKHTKEIKNYQLKNKEKIKATKHEWYLKKKEMIKMKKKRLKVMDVKGLNTVFKSYRVVPYPEIVEIIKNGGEAFVEAIDRRTAYSAKQVLSKKLGFKVKSEKRIVLTGKKDDYLEGIEGYVFSKDS
ncbi:hypothetical protein ES702_02204 [subsurface metagenome]